MEMFVAGIDIKPVEMQGVKWEKRSGIAELCRWKVRSRDVFEGEKHAPFP